MMGNYTLIQSKVQMFNKSRPAKKTVRFELIPMIDIMMILVLFLAVMAFMPQIQSALQTDLPSSSSNDEVSVEDIVVNINATGNISIGEHSATVNELVPELQRQMKGDNKRRIVIAADKSLPYEQVVRILEALRKAEIQNVALATEKAE